MHLRSCLRLRLPLAAVALTMLASACGHTELVYREPTGGQLALKGARRAAMKRAHKDMQAHCGATGYQITREENVVLGTNKSTVAQMGVSPEGFGGQYVTSESVVRENRLTYLCNDGVPGELAVRW